METPPTREDYAFATFVRVGLGEGRWLVGIAAVGMMDSAGNAVQGVPSLAASTDALVERMMDQEICTFHEVVSPPNHRGNSTPQLAYAPLLLAQGSPLALPLLQVVIARLAALFPNRADLLAVLQDDLAWKAQVAPLGGAR